MLEMHLILGLGLGSGLELGLGSGLGYVTCDVTCAVAECSHSIVRCRRIVREPFHQYSVRAIRRNRIYLSEMLKLELNLHFDFIQILSTSEPRKKGGYGENGQ